MKEISLHEIAWESKQKHTFQSWKGEKSDINCKRMIDSETMSNKNQNKIKTSN
jgi:hypothetical protein